MKDSLTSTLQLLLFTNTARFCWLLQIGPMAIPAITALPPGKFFLAALNLVTVLRCHCGLEPHSRYHSSSTRLDALKLPALSLVKWRTTDDRSITICNRIVPLMIIHVAPPLVFPGCLQTNTALTLYAGEEM